LIVTDRSTGEVESTDARATVFEPAPGRVAVGELSTQARVVVFVADEADRGEAAVEVAPARAKTLTGESLTGLESTVARLALLEPIGRPLATVEVDVAAVTLLEASGRSDGVVLSTVARVESFAPSGRSVAVVESESVLAADFVPVGRSSGVPLSVVERAATFEPAGRSVAVALSTVAPPMMTAAKCFMTTEIASHVRAIEMVSDCVAVAPDWTVLVADAASAKPPAAPPVIKSHSACALTGGKPMRGSRFALAHMFQSVL
jgi:hypothetical protein